MIAVGNTRFFNIPLKAQKLANYAVRTRITQKSDGNVAQVLLSLAGQLGFASALRRAVRYDKAVANPQNAPCVRRYLGIVRDDDDRSSAHVEALEER
jgi:hypothetical protein